MYFTKHLTIGIIIIMIALIFHSPIVKAQEDSTLREFEAIFTGQEIPSSEVTIHNNLADSDEVRTEIDVWETDLGTEVTDGSYVGGLFESSLFEMDFDPLRANQTYDYNHVQLNHFMNPNIPKRRSVILLSSEVVFNNRIIMSGATEFYIRIPLNPNCVDFNEMYPAVNLFDIGTSTLDREKLWLEGASTVTQTVWETETTYDLDGNQVTVPTRIGDPLPYNDSWSLRVVYDGQESDIKQNVNIFENDHMYARVFGTIEPNRNYIVSVVAILKSNPQIYLTEEDIFDNGRSGAYSISSIEYTKTEELWMDRIEQDGESYPKGIIKTWSNIVFTTYGVEDSIPQGISYVNSFLNTTNEFPVDFAWSFIFKSGRGNHGMFGKKIHFEENDSLVFYKNMTEIPQGNQYISVMLPFISEERIAVNISATIITNHEMWGRKFESERVFDVYTDPTNSTNVTVTSGWTSRHWWDSSELPVTAWTDYMLFTIPLRLRSETFPTSEDFAIKIAITFEQSCDITLMFSTLNNHGLNEEIEDYYYKDVDKSSERDFPYDSEWLSNVQRFRLTYIYKNTRPVDTELFAYQNETFDSSSINGYDPLFITTKKRQLLSSEPSTTLHYELFSSVQFTDGIWQQIVTTSGGDQYSTHLFKRRMAVGVIELWVDTSETEELFQQKWYENGYLNLAGELWDKGDYLGAIRYGIQGIATALWDGLAEFFGSIINTFSKVWDTLVGIGHFVYSILKDFVDTVWSIIQDIYSGLEDIAFVFLYIITIFVFMFILGWVGRLLYIDRQVARI